jgi:hypothetical protein
MTSSVTNDRKAVALIAVAVAIGAAGIYVAWTDDRACQDSVPQASTCS